MLPDQQNRNNPPSDNEHTGQLVGELISLIDGYVLQSAGPDILSTGPYKPVVSKLLQNVGCPPGYSAAGEYRSEKISRNTEGVVG